MHGEIFLVCLCAVETKLPRCVCVFDYKEVDVYLVRNFGGIYEAYEGALAG